MNTRDSSMQGDADVARVAALIGDRTRARVLMALLGDRALPAGVLAAESGVSASTISEHLARLLEASLVVAERHGRGRYFRLAGPAVAEAIEAPARIAPPEPVRSLRENTRAQALRRARTCYHHLGGRLGVAIIDALLARELITADRAEGRPGSRLAPPTWRLTSTGHHELGSFGVDVQTVTRRRPAGRSCLDWSERRHHLAGPLGTALTRRMFDLDWLRHGGGARAVRLTDAGHDGLEATFGVIAEPTRTS